MYPQKLSQIRHSFITLHYHRYLNSKYFFSDKISEILALKPDQLFRLRQSTAEFVTTPRHENPNQSVSVTYDAPVPKQSYQSPVRQLSEAKSYRFVYQRWLRLKFFLLILTSTFKNNFYDAPSYNIGNPNQSSFSIANSIDSLSNVITNSNRDNNRQHSLTITVGESQPITLSVLKEFFERIFFFEDFFTNCPHPKKHASRRNEQAFDTKKTEPTTAWRRLFLEFYDKIQLNYGGIT